MSGPPSARDSNGGGPAKPTLRRAVGRCEEGMTKRPTQALEPRPDAMKPPPTHGGFMPPGTLVATGAKQVEFGRLLHHLRNSTKDRTPASGAWLRTKAGGPKWGAPRRAIMPAGRHARAEGSVPEERTSAVDPGSQWGYRRRRCCAIGTLSDVFEVRMRFGDGRETFAVVPRRDGGSGGGCSPGATGTASRSLRAPTDPSARQRRGGRRSAEWHAP
jgi:hypothetical protein